MRLHLGCQKWERGVVLALGVLLGVCTACSPSDSSEPASGRTPPKMSLQEPKETEPVQPEQTESTVVDLTLPPISTFEAKCAICHGHQASLHLDRFAALGDTELHGMVDQMMRGPGMLKPTDPDVEAMVAYHRALAKREPFAAVINAKSFSDGETTELLIEAAPEAILKATEGDTEKEIGKRGRFWTLRGGSAQSFHIEVWREATGAQEASRPVAAFTYPRELWSHAKPPQEKSGEENQE